MEPITPHHLSLCLLKFHDMVKLNTCMLFFTVLFIYLFIYLPHKQNLSTMINNLITQINIQDYNEDTKLQFLC